MIIVEELQPYDVFCHAQYGLVSYSPDKHQVDYYNQEDLKEIRVITIMGHRVKVDPNECFEVKQKAKMFYWSKLVELAVDFVVGNEGKKMMITLNRHVFINVDEDYEDMGQLGPMIESNEMNPFDQILQNLGIPREKRSNINQIELEVDTFNYE